MMTTTLAYFDKVVAILVDIFLAESPGVFKGIVR
jgi:hypothetical protein